MRALHSAERSGKKLGRCGRRAISLLLCLCMTIPMLFSLSDVFSMRALAAGTSGPTNGVTRQADPSTMDTYKSQLDFSVNTRVAGRLWSDKSVFAYGSNDTGDRAASWNGRVLTLSDVLDGVNGTIELNDDFLHVYSALGSSQNVNTENARPLDVVLLLDISRSMTGNSNTSIATRNDSLHQVIAQANQLIARLMNNEGETKSIDGENVKTQDPAVHKENRVGVVVYGGGAQTLLPLNHYTSSGNDGIFFSATEGTKYSVNGNYTYFANVSTSVKGGYTKKTGAMVADSTYLQGALYKGMEMLATATETTYHPGMADEAKRMPVLIVLTDGATNIISTTSSSNSGRTSYEWWAPFGSGNNQDIIPSAGTGAQYAGAGLNPYYADCNEGTGKGSGASGRGSVANKNLEIQAIAPRTVSNLLLAGYYKNKIQAHYDEEMKGFSIGYNVGGLGNYATEQLWSTMDPRTYFSDAHKAEKAGDAKAMSEITDAENALKSYIAKSAPSMRFPRADGSRYIFVDSAGSYCNFTWNHPSDTANDITSFEQLYYINEYFEAGDHNIEDIFDSIFETITTTIFAPVSGKNDFGVNNSVTYTDPVGKYMDVKDVKNLVLFGKKYDIVQTVVYDYQWNEAYIEAMENAGNTAFKKGETALPQGWYRGEPTAKAEFVSQDDKSNNGLPDGCSSAADAWSKNWVFRVNYKTAAQFVPTLSEIRDPSKALEKERKTEYTFYRLDMKDEDRKVLHMNPAYGTDEDIPADVTYQDDQSHMKTPGVYALADLRIWVEDSGDYSDTDVEGTLTDANFDEALWINIPANMLPLRTVTINQSADGTFTYKTNLDPTDPGYLASFPLRVFYTVGVSEEALDDSNRINIAGAIGPEYIEQNKVKNAAASTARNVPQGNLEFFSNWYNPLNRYGDYVTTNTDYSYGDPVTSFSPATSNRYYLFEKALPLYNTAYVLNGGEWRKVSIGEDLGEEEGGAKFDATTFGGNLIAQDLEPANTQGTPEERQKAIRDALDAKGVTANEGDIILLKTHRLTNVAKPEDDAEADPFSSDDYFFLPIEYYELKADGSATRTKYAITRKGSEFGSAYKAAGITNGDMLCWHDMSGKYTQDYPYLSYSETGDRSRGKDYIGATIDPDTGYYAGCDKSNHEYPEEKPSNPLSDGEWVVCAKPGGLRVGNLAQNVQNKGGAYSTEAESKQIKAYIAERYHDDESATSLNWGYYAQNVTRTANNYYLPTISSTSNIERSDIKVNVYLGNNGRLYVMDTTLLVTKMVEAPDGMTVDPDEEFNFQVFINGVTGTQSAIVVQWDESAGSWQRQFHYIDLELDSQLFLQTSNGTKATVDADGCRLIADPSGNYTYAEECTGETAGKHSAGDSYEGKIYYVFIGRNRGTTDLGVADTAFRVYHNANMKDGVGSVGTEDVAVDGSRGEEGTFFAAKVWLVSEEAYLAQWVPETGDRPDPTAEGFNAEDYGGTLYKNKEGEAKQFELLTINPNISETSELAIKTPYRTLSAYWTKEVEFGKNANENDGSGKVGQDLVVNSDQNDLYDPILPTGDRPDYFANLTNEEIAKHTAEFTLKHGQALLFGGIPSGAIYRVTEKLTEKQLQAGYALKEVSHKQQVGSVSTYRPGAQSIPVYTKNGATYGEYGGGKYPTEYEDDTTEKGLFWAVNKNGNSVEGAGVAGVVKSEEPFAHTNAVLWESYATMNKDAPGDNHHQPKDVPDGSSVFWLWDESTGESRNTGTRHDVLDNPGCVSVDSVDKIAEGKCDVPQSDGTVRHYMFYEGTMVDRHYEGEGSGYIRNIGRYIVSPTVHFGVVGEEQADAVTSAQDTKSNTQYTGVYSVFGNTGTYEESANFINTVDPDLLVITKQLVDMNGSVIDTPPEREFTFTVSFTQPDDAPVKPGTLYLWKGNMDLQSGGAKWSDGSHTMPAAAPKQSEYQNYILPATGEGTGSYLEPLKANEDGTYTVKLKAKQGAVLYGLAAGTHYTVVETSVPKYPSVDPAHPGSSEGDWLTREGEIVHNAATYLEMMPSDSPNRADYVNQVFNGTLTVEKRIDGDSGDTETRDFAFSVTLKPAEGAELSAEDLTVEKYAKGAAEGEKLTVTWTETDGVFTATFTLKHGEKVVIGGIPADTAYTVKETGRGGYNLQHVADNTSNAPDESGSYLELSDDSVSGTVTTDTVDIYLLFVNGKAVAPPFTGGVGASEIMFVGALLIGLSIVLFLFGRRKNRRVI